MNINTADQAALETLPGIAPVLAGRVIAERELNGPFEAVEALTRGEGISSSTGEELCLLVITGD